MNKIDKGYAILYTDDDLTLQKMIMGFSTDPIEFNESFKEWVDKNIPADFYSTPGPMQWNYYLILADNIHPIRKEYLLEWDTYFRVVFYDQDEKTLEEFIADQYPDYIPEKAGTITQMYRKNFNEYDQEINTNALYLYRNYSLIERSSLRWNNEMDTLTLMDDMRTGLIKGDFKNILYATHIRWELSMLEKKFKFLGDNFKII